MTLSSSCSATSFSLMGEIENKKRVGKKVIGQKKFVAVPEIMTLDSSSFSRLMVSDNELDQVVVKYISDNKKKLIHNTYSITDSIIDKFNVKEFENKIELYRPGMMTLDFKYKNKIIETKKIRFLGGD
jgi:hypothetical protein